MKDLRSKNPTKFSTDKSSALIVFPMSGSNILAQKIVSVCRAFEMMIIPVPKSQQEIKRKIDNQEQELLEYIELNSQTKMLLVDKLQTLSKHSHDYKCSHVELLRLSVVKERSVYTVLNMLSHLEHLYIGSF